MASIETELKYLFVAEYDDGECLVQSADDKSINHDDTKEHNPSAFSDIDHSRLKRFHLVVPQDGEQLPVASVDLTTGEFQIVGMQFSVVQDAKLKPGEKLELIYYRETRKELTVKATVQEDKSIKEESVRRDYINRYFIGWKNPDTNEERVIGIQ